MRALATRLCYGVIQNRMLLDYYIGCWCSQRPERLESVIRNILRLGGYQILFLDKVPPRAAVNEAVEMTKRHRREKAAGMVNAILRKFAANREDMPPLPKGSPGADSLPAIQPPPVAGGASAFPHRRGGDGGVSPYEQSGSTHYHPDKPPEGYPGGAGEAAAPDRRTRWSPTRG